MKKFYLSLALAAAFYAAMFWLMRHTDAMLWL